MSGKQKCLDATLITQMSTLGRVNLFLLQPIFESGSNIATIGQIRTIYNVFNENMLLYFVYDSSFNENLFNELQGICTTCSVEYGHENFFWENYLNCFFQNYLGNNVKVLLSYPKTNTIKTVLIVLKHIGDTFYIKDEIFYCQQHNYSLYRDIKKIIAPYKLTYYCSSYYVPNGDIIETEDFVLLGRYSIHNGDNPSNFLDELKKRRKWNSKQILVLGPKNMNNKFYSANFFYHLDLCLMYLGKVGCNKHTFLLGQLKYDKTIHTGKNDKANIRQLNIALNKIADDLVKINETKVVRVLLPYINQGVYTFLNGIVENYTCAFKIYVPKYLFENHKIEQEYYNKLYSLFCDIVSKIDANVVSTADYTNQVFSYGALHCTMNVISRTKC